MADVKDWRSMAAGFDLDALVAERVFGCKVGWASSHRPWPYCTCSLRHGHNQFWDEQNDDTLADYSTGHEACAQIKEWLIDGYMGFTVTGMKDGWTVTLHCLPEDKIGIADTEPLAFCRAVLALKEPKV
jgi:hypothetical protein